MRIVIVAACSMSLCACSGGGTASDSIRKPATAKEVEAVRKHVADAARINAAAPVRRDPAALRAKAMQPVVGTWMSSGQFSGGRLRMIVSNDGSMVLEALTSKNASLSMAMGSILVSPDGSVSGRLTRPTWPLKPFGIWKAAVLKNGRIAIQGEGQTVEMTRQQI